MSSKDELVGQLVFYRGAIGPGLFLCPVTRANQLAGWPATCSSIDELVVGQLVSINELVIAQLVSVNELVVGQLVSINELNDCRKSTGPKSTHRRVGNPGNPYGRAEGPPS